MQEWAKQSKTMTTLYEFTEPWESFLLPSMKGPTCCFFTQPLERTTTDATWYLEPLNNIPANHSPLRTRYLFDPDLQRRIEQCGLAVHLSFGGLLKTTLMLNLPWKKLKQVTPLPQYGRSIPATKSQNRTSKAAVKQHRHGLRGCHHPRASCTVQVPLHLSRLEFWERFHQVSSSQWTPPTSLIRHKDPLVTRSEYGHYMTLWIII